MNTLYNKLSPYLRQKYGCRVGKICIDGGFSCPNRDGKCGVGGCTFCGERGAGEHMQGYLSIDRQVNAFLNSVAATKAKAYIAYFQNFTNTYAPPEILRKRYDSALTDERIRVLAVGTRPDCIDEETADLLHSYTKKLDVWAELGFQTSNDENARLFNRGYKSEVFTKSVSLLDERGIEVIVHVMVGLPNETEDDVYKTIDFVNSHPIHGIKLHSLYVTEDTPLAQDFRSGKYVPCEMDDYIRVAANCIARLRPDIITHRITSDAPKKTLIAPSWNLRKMDVVNGIEDYMKKNGLYQGSLYNKAQA